MKWAQHGRYLSRAPAAIVDTSQVCFPPQVDAAVKRSSLSFVTDPFKSFLETGWFNLLPSSAPPPSNHMRTPTPTHAFTRRHTHTHPLIGCWTNHWPSLCNLWGSIGRLFFPAMFTSLWAIWPQWGDCLRSTTCVPPAWLAARGHQRRSVTFSTYWKE